MAVSEAVCERVPSIVLVVVLMVLAVVLTAVTGVGSSPTVSESGSDFFWIRQFGTSPGERLLDVAVDASGVYVVGDMWNSLSGQVDASSSDDFIRKYDPNGNELWIRQFGTAQEDHVRGVAVGVFGAYVVGRTSGTFPNQTSAGEIDAFIMKYDPNGNELWIRQFGTASWDWASGVAVDASGVYVTGLTLGAFPGQESAGNDDAFVRKYDPDGNELWTRQFGAPTFGADWTFGAVEVAVDVSGLYVAGGTYGTFPGQTSAGARDAFVRKYDPDGNELWTRQFGTPGFELVRAVDVDASGVYAAGSTSDTFPGRTNAGGSDVFVRKYDPDGNEIWTRQFGTAIMDDAYGVAVEASYVYVAGQTYGTWPDQTSAGYEPTFLRKFDASGGDLWTRQFAGVNATAVAVDRSAVYLAGHAGSPTGGVGGFLAAFVESPGPALALTAPADGTTVQEGTVLVAGTTEADAHLVVNGLVVAVSPSGSFSLNLALKEGTNVITATATNSTGYSTTIYRTVTYENPLPSLEEELQETRDELGATRQALAALGTQVVVGFVVIAGILSTLQYLLFRRLRRPGGAKPAHGGSETTGPPENVSVPDPLQPPPSLEGSVSRPTRRAPAGQLPNRTIRLTTKERILLHLARYARSAEAAEVPPALTQEGVASATWIEPRHLAQYVDPLVRDDLVGVRSAHVRNGSQRRRVYELTDAGRRVAARLLARAKSEVVPVWDGEHVWDVRVGDIMEKMNHKLSVLELARHLAEAGVVDFAALGLDREDSSAEAGNTDLGEPSDATTGER